MKNLIINSKTFVHIGEPLEAFIFDGEYWGGRSNFLASNEKEKTSIDLENLEDCFAWMSRWSNESDYVRGYVLDYSTKTIYYDKEEAKDYLLKRAFPKRGEENYFDKFVQRDFSV